MPKQTLVFESEADLSIKEGQLMIKTEGKEPIYRSIEDIGVVMIDHHSVRLTIPLINRLAENNVAVVFCNERHMPVTMLMDLDSNSVQTRHFKAQIEASQPLKKQIWKQIVEAKIRNQSLLLEKLGRGIGILDSYKSSVKSGDSTNREGKRLWRNARLVLCL